MALMRMAECSRPVALHRAIEPVRMLAMSMPPHLSVWRCEGQCSERMLRSSRVSGRLVHGSDRARFRQLRAFAFFSGRSV